MLIDEAETVDDAEHERLMAKAEAEGIQPTSRSMMRARELVAAVRPPGSRTQMGSGAAPVES